MTSFNRTFKLFDYLKVPQIKYYIDGKATPERCCSYPNSTFDKWLTTVIFLSRYNDITKIKSDLHVSKDPNESDDESNYKDDFKVSTKNKGKIMPE